MVCALAGAYGGNLKRQRNACLKTPMRLFFRMSAKPKAAVFFIGYAAAFGFNGGYIQPKLRSNTMPAAAGTSAPSVVMPMMLAAITSLPPIARAIT